MMMGIIVKQLTEKLLKFLSDNNGEYNVTTEWVNNWLKENNSTIVTKIVGHDGNEILGASVHISEKRSS